MERFPALGRVENDCYESSDLSNPQYFLRRTYSFHYLFRSVLTQSCHIVLKRFSLDSICIGSSQNFFLDPLSDIHDFINSRSSEIAGLQALIAPLPDK